MNKQGSILMLGFACAFLWFNIGMDANENDLPRLPGAALLTGYPPGTLKVTTPNSTWSLQDGGDYLRISPSISRDGMVIASARVIDDGIARSSPRLSIASYSMIGKKWTDYQEIAEYEGGIAIAPDGSMLAFAAADYRELIPVKMHVIDLESGKERIIPAKGRPGGVSLSWSPDGRRIAYDMVPKMHPDGAKEYLPEIGVLELETGKTTKLADGFRPAWSPSGEWIAHFDLTPDRRNLREWGYTPAGPNRLVLVHPDGTGSKLLLTLSSNRAFTASPVWSPDSKMILLNEIRDELKGTKDIHLLDLSTLKMTRIFKGTPPVFGWAEAK
ncbi:MAG: hypothetical protein M1453_00725 [Acidobacteria bacterium]|nr:hypothetical protein [Acidobacteriota bacterium]